MLTVPDGNFLETYPFLAVLDRPLDDRQLKVCCTDGDDAATDNIVVAAGAGSGKTQVLAARFAFLVVTGAAAADEILTLTFTKKAAAEMYQRIYKTLQKIASSPQARLTEVQQQRVDHALRDFSNAHIQTLDSYCTYLVKQAANRYGIRPDFTSGGDSAQIKAKALSYVLTHQKSRGIAALAQPGGIQQIAEQVFAPVITSYTSVISPADFFSAKLPRQCGIVCQGWNEAAQAFNDLFDSCPDVLSELEGVISSIKKKDPSKKSGPERLLDAATIIISSEIKVPLLSEDDILHHTRDEEISALYGSLVQVYKVLKTALYNIRLTKDISSSPVLLDFFNTVKAWKEDFAFAPLYSFIRHVEDVRDLLAHFDTFLQECNRFKKQSGELTFNDVSELALAILKDHEDIRSQEHETYRRIMIDEFQDNNRKNGILLSLIGRPTFFVGDDKQSIYKFRGAEVDVFNEKQNEMKRGKGAVLPMDYNYRSNQELLASFNLIFGGYRVKDPVALKNPLSRKSEKFEKITGAAATQISAPTSLAPASTATSTSGSHPWVFDEAFSTSPEGIFTDTYKALFTIDSTAEKNPVVVPRPKDTFAENNPLGASVPVHCVMYNTKLADEGEKDEFLDVQRRLALSIARTIQSLREKDPRFSYSDVAILDRSRTNRGALTDVLSRFGIPYSVDQYADLFSEAIINDFYHFLRLCVYPFDVNAFASFLRSPFAALSQKSLESVLFVAVKQKTSPQEDDPVFQAFSLEDEESVLAALSPSEGQKYLKAQRLFTEYRDVVLRSKLSQTISRLWYHLGYWYNTAWHKDTAVFSTQYDLLFALACQSDADGHTAAWFVDQLSALKNASSFGSSDSEMDVKEVSFPLEESDAVKIMTIHKSKGLQFKYVFVLGCTGSPRGEANKTRYYFHEESGLSVKFNDDTSNYFFLRQKELADDKNDAEFRRLFYVALTRAEQQAWILGSWGRPKSKSAGESSMVESIIEYNYEITDPTLKEIQEKGLEQTTYPYNADSGAPFDFTALYPVEALSLYTQKVDAPTKALMAEKIAALAPLVQGAQIVPLPVPAPNRLSPSRLESTDGDEKKWGSNAPYGEVNQIIEKTWNSELELYEFGYNDFGTLAHLFMEMHVKGVDVNTWLPPESLMKKLYGSNRDTLIATCRSMVHTFVESQRGKDVENARSMKAFLRTEYAFRMKLAGFFITGAIDLLYKSEKGYVIVDYKTDQDMNPQRYYEQQYCYRKAASCLCRVPEDEISCVLFYLRYGKEIDITAEVAKVKEENLLQSPPAVNVD